ncbi:MAG: hypothetical protein ACXAAH_14625 [Promethearchaeota archaeon]|jgi:beta-1,4-mannosyl-glycoprotein beta-1,4-N-acetylglucosaminyltransferase
MIVDCFTFWKEFDILEIRLNELNDIVDYFVLVEAAYTQAMQPKPFYFDENKERFAKFADKIIHVKVEEGLDISQNPWAYENYQRRCVAKGLNELDIKADDYIMISDVDEIPNPRSLERILPTISPLVCLGMTYHVYYLDLVVKNKILTGTVACKAGAIDCDMHTLIKLRDRLPPELITSNDGWHMGYQGGEQVVFDKYFSCIEPFNKSLIPGRELFSQVFNERARDGGHFIFCDNLSKIEQPLAQVDCSFPLVPNHISQNTDKYKEFLLCSQ